MIEFPEAAPPICLTRAASLAPASAHPRSAHLADQLDPIAESATGRLVAIQVLKERSDQLPTSPADGNSRLEHSNLLSAHEEPGSTVPGFPRIVHIADFCAGGELFDRLVKRGVFSEAQVAKINRAVQQLHEMSIIHRGLKSENILTWAWR